MNTFSNWEQRSITWLACKKKKAFISSVLQAALSSERGANTWLQLNGEVRSDAEPPGSEEADASLSLT